MRPLHIECKTVIDIVICGFKRVSAAALVHHSDIECTLEAQYLSVVEEHAAKEVVLVD
jgi:hypothetical protein